MAARILVTDTRVPIAETCDVADLFYLGAPADQSALSDTSAVRRSSSSTSHGFATKIDVFLGGAAACCFMRVASDRARAINFRLVGSYRVTACASGGWLILPTADDDLDTYWLPQVPYLRRVDSFGHILEERSLEFSDIAISSATLGFRADIPRNFVLDWSAWRFRAEIRNTVDELRYLLPVEMQRRFLWGSHTAFGRPADIYLSLLHGHVYENRMRWPKQWKIFSENDAHALYTIMSGLQSATGKQIYRLLKEQLLLAVLDRQGEDGAWRHGEWTDRMECHFRLHCSAMHMLMDALTEKNNLAVRTALERAATFLSKQTDNLDVGTWFLHDELECSVESLREGPFAWLRSRALGKSEANMLVLNSHLDAIVAMDRYRQVTSDARYEGLVVRAVSATHAVLSLRPVEWLYKILFKAIHLTFLPTGRAARLPAHLRAVKRVAWKYLIPLLPYIKARFPRIVMPGGYIDRELSLRVFAHDYLAVNVMDLLRYRRRFPDETIDVVVLAAMSLVRDHQLIDRWPEIKGKEYAVGFWAEALYQMCLVRPEAQYRALLAETVVALERQSLGLPPSLLGANGEAVSPQERVPTPVPDDGRIRVVNLSQKGMCEVLLINCSGEAVRPHIVRNAPAGLAWSVGEETEAFAATPLEIPGGGWLWGRSLTRAGAPA